MGNRIRSKEGYFPVPPADTLLDLRSEMSLQMEAWGIEVEMQHHEVASAGQCEIDMKYNSLARMADSLMGYKYIVKNVARRHGLTATFMPKPLFGDNGNGMHCHQSLWKGGANLFYSEGGYAELSQEALHYIGGLLTHVNALLGLCACTTNSYRRLVPHYEAPVNIAFSKRNRSAAIRIPMYFAGPAAASSKRVEFRCPDATCNPYLAFAAMLMAGLDGIKRKIDPTKAGFGPLDRNTYELPPDEAAKIKSVPGSLERLARGARGRPRVPARGGRLHARPARHVDRLQAHEGSPRGQHPARALRVLPVLRRVGGRATRIREMRERARRRGRRVLSLRARRYLQESVRSTANSRTPWNAANPSRAAARRARRRRVGTTPRSRCSSRTTRRPRSRSSHGSSRPISREPHRIGIA